MLYAVVKMLRGIKLPRSKNSIGDMPRTWILHNFILNGFVSVFFYVFSSLQPINSFFCITLHILVVYLGIKVLKPLVFNGKMFSLPYDLQFQYHGKEESLSLKKRQNL